MPRILCIGTMLAGLVMPPPQAGTFPRSASLTPELIEQAVAEGMGDAVVAPYRLLSEIGTPPNQKAAVYTPFIRVALAARAARARGVEAFDAATLPQWVTAPQVLVVFSAPCRDAPPCSYHGFEFDDTTPLMQVSVAPGIPALAASGRRDIIPAAAISTDLSLLGLIGGPPFANARVAATFEPHTFGAGLTVFAAWSLDDGKVIVYSGGRLTEADLRSWR